MASKRRSARRRSHDSPKTVEQSAEQEDSVRRLRRLAGLTDVGEENENIAQALSRLLGRGYREESE